MLRTIAHKRVVTHFPLSTLDRQNTGQKLQQRRFACAVRANENSALVSLNGIVEAPVDHGFAIGMVNRLELQDFSTTPLRLRKTEANMTLSEVRRFNFVHPVDLFSLALRLGCLGVFGPEPIDESLKLFDLLLLVFIGSQDLLLPGRFLYDIFVVVAAVGDQFVLIDL